MKITLKVTLAVWMMVHLLAVVPAFAEKPALNGSLYSDTIDQNQTSATPAGIELKAERSHVTADDMDNIKLTAFVYDAQGKPVADGFKVNFTIGSAINNNFMGHEYFDYVPGAQGRLGSPDNPDNFYQGTTWDNSGRASVQFGWIDELYGGNNSTIWAYSADNASVFASTKIYSSAPTAAWTGYVVDSSGSGLGGINVKLHVMGVNATGQYEIYNMTRTTSRSSPYVGRFAFDYIVLQGEAYSYIDAEARLADNLTAYGRSDNLSMNRSVVSIGNIVLSVPPPNGTTTSPSATIVPTPGFEALFALAGLSGVVYLIARKEG